jgi:hypothetical protein
LFLIAADSGRQCVQCAPQLITSGTFVGLHHVAALVLRKQVVLGPVARDRRLRIGWPERHPGEPAGEGGAAGRAARGGGGCRTIRGFWRAVAIREDGVGSVSAGGCRLG